MCPEIGGCAARLTSKVAGFNRVRGSIGCYIFWQNTKNAIIRTPDMPRLADTFR